MPTVLSIVHGGISRLETFARIERAQGRASSKVWSDIGAIDPGRWQSWQDRWKIGAMSFVKVGAPAGVVVFCAWGRLASVTSPTRVPSTTLFIAGTPCTALFRASDPTPVKLFPR